MQRSHSAARRLRFFAATGSLFLPPVIPLISANYRPVTGLLSSRDSLSHELFSQAADNKGLFAPRLVGVAELFPVFLAVTGKNARRVALGPMRKSHNFRPTEPHPCATRPGLGPRSEGRGRGIGTDPAIGRVERVDASHIVAIESEAERADVLSQALELHRFGNDDQAAFEMPADHDLRRRLAMFRRDVGNGWIAQQGPATERAPGFCFDPMLVVKRAQCPLLKPRMELDLIDRGRDPVSPMMRSR
jgi:hypothetical protein